MIWWVICENRLRIGFRNEFLTFTSENEVDLDELHTLKITFRNGLEIGMGNFPQHFLPDFPARFSCKNFPQDFPQDFLQEFPTRFSRKIFSKPFLTVIFKIFNSSRSRKFPIPISKPFLKVIFKICNSSTSTSFSLVNVKNSFLKPILNRFSHMTHQIEA